MKSEAYILAVDPENTDNIYAASERCRVVCEHERSRKLESNEPSAGRRRRSSVAGDGSTKLERHLRRSRAVMIVTDCEKGKRRTI
jgi:hypothetical protein